MAADADAADADAVDAFSFYTRRFERYSAVHWILPAFRRAEASKLTFQTLISRRTALDFNQNAGVAIFGHHPPAAIAAIDEIISAGTPLRLPFARCVDEESLSTMILARASPLLEGKEYASVMGMRSGAEAVDMALSLAWSSLQPQPSPTTPLMVIVLHGSFHGNCTRAAFSASAVFRAHPQAASLCEFEQTVLLPVDASAADIAKAFAPHDRGVCVCVAVIFEPQQHFAAFASPGTETMSQLVAAAAARRVPTIADEIWSGVYRTGSFLATPIRPSMIVLGKGLSVGVGKHSVLLVERWRFSAFELLPPPPCALCCHVAHACLVAETDAAVAARAVELSELMTAHGVAASGWLLPVRGRGYSYEVELRATAAQSSNAIRILTCAVCWLYMLWARGLWMLPRPLRAPRRFHLELDLRVTDDEVAHAFGALRAAASVAAFLSFILMPVDWMMSLTARDGNSPPSARDLLTAPPSRARGADETADETAASIVGAALATEAMYHRALSVAGKLPTYTRAAGELLFGASSTVGVIDCCADRSTSVLGHNHSVPTSAFKGFIAARAPVMPFGLLFMKPTAQALCKTLESMATDATAAAAAMSSLQRHDGDPPRLPPVWRARLMLSATDANEAALRLCLIHWERRWKRSRSTADEGMPTPRILIIGRGNHGHSWLLSGRPTRNVRLIALPLDALDTDAAMDCLQAVLQQHTPPRLPATDRLSSESRHISPFAAILLEPVCSQTGMRLSAGAAAAVRSICDLHSIPLVCDETRTGLMRCGDALLAAPALGLMPDVATLGEALGGGCTSVSAVLFSTGVFSRERAASPFPSSATMVNDNLSSHVALGVLSHLKHAAADIGNAAARFELAVRDACDGAAGVCEVHGCGLMLAVRIDATVLAKLSVVANTADPGGAVGHSSSSRPASGCAGVAPILLLHSYLLGVHGVRARPTTDALVLDMPAVASSESVKRVGVALRVLTRVLATGAFEEVLRHW